MYFHVSQLKKYVHDSKHIVDWNVIQMEPKGLFQVEPMCILDKKETMLQNQVIGQVKVQGKNPGSDEATWELDDSMQEAYPFLFISQDTKDGVILWGRRM